MNHFRCSVFCFFYPILISFLLFSEGHPTDSADTSPDYKNLFDKLTSLELDEQKVLDIKDFVFKRDVGSFNLKSGTFYFCKPVFEKIIAGVFIGDGHFSFTPPTKVEKEQLIRYTEKDTFAQDFNFLLMIFTDSTYQELTNRFYFQNGSASVQTSDLLEYAINFFVDKDIDYFDTNLMKTFLEDGTPGIFYGYFSKEKSDPYLFEVIPSEEEAIEFYRRTGSWIHHDFELVNKFSKQSITKNNSSNNQLTDEFVASNYEISSEIEDDLDFKGMAKFSFMPLLKNHKWITLYLDKKLIVDSIFWTNETRATFFRGEDNPELWIKANLIFNKNEVQSLKIYYHGDLLEKNELGWIRLNSSSQWYPRIYSKARSYYNLKFKYPSRYKLASVGKLVSENSTEEFTTSQWITPFPVRSVSFNIGKFKEWVYEEKDFPAIKIYMFDGGHREMSSILTPMGILSSSDMDEMVGRDVVNSISFYNNTFGNIQFQNNLYATEIPYLHGEAFPGLIHFSWVTFQGINGLEKDVIFRAHEIAHQWWGIQVGFKSYHDQWLSEGFATYSGLWLLQTAIQDNSKFFDVLADWKKEIIENRKYLFGKGQEAGPIWLGYRTSSENTEGDYNLIIYKKGAWVLHMLRNLLLDLKNFSDDKFKAMMKEFFVTNIGLNPSTEDFKLLVDKYCGEDMSWFFNNWIYGTSIPNYKFAYKTQKQPDGLFTFKLKVKQENVDSTFFMPMPIAFDFGDGRSGKIRIEIKDKNSEVSITNLPAEPKEVLFNYLSSVLCEYEIVDYKDI